MTLSDLETATGHAVTATGSLIRMRDAIRMASHAHRYLALFDDHGRPLHLGRTERIATADQRIVLIAADRGCTSLAVPDPRPGHRSTTSTNGPPAGTPTSTPSPTVATCATHSSDLTTPTGQQRKPDQATPTLAAPSGIPRPHSTPPEKATSTTTTTPTNTSTQRPKTARPNTPRPQHNPGHRDAAAPIHTRHPADTTRVAGHQ
uniref:DUF222 domain-containing protein n=1 Tax=Rhodococcus sp. H36-A4 TaxID=3004353 RepID=UPI002F34FA19